MINNNKCDKCCKKFQNCKILSDTDCNTHSRILPKNYQHILALAFAVKQINENPQILPNISLGFHIYDNYYNAKWTYHSTMLLIYTLEQFFPNYNCNMQNKLLAVIGGLDSLTSLDMAIVLDTYKIPQVRFANKV